MSLQVYSTFANLYGYLRELVELQDFLTYHLPTQTCRGSVLTFKYYSHTYVDRLPHLCMKLFTIVSCTKKVHENLGI